MRYLPAAFVLGSLLHAVPGLAQASPATPSAALGVIGSLGADSAFAMFYADSALWSQLVGHIQAGDTTWFPVSDALEPARSKHARGLAELDYAMVASITRQPAALFSYHLARGWTPDQIAGAFCIPLPDAPQGGAEYLQSAFNAVEALKVPALKSTRKACLGAFEKLQP
jgi:hypothetical protein